MPPPKLAAPGGPIEDSASPLLTAIEELPERQRIVVQAFSLEETSTERVAALLGVSSRAVEGLLRRARTQLAADLRRAEAAS